MARFNGRVGFGQQVKTAGGVAEDLLTEKTYRGDVIRNVKNLEQGDKINDDVSVNVSISIVADTYAIEHLSNIKYVEWSRVLWTLTSVEPRHPRLILNLGRVYNGPTP